MSLINSFRSVLRGPPPDHAPLSYAFANAAGCRNLRATTTSATMVITAGAVEARSDADSGMIPMVFHWRTVAATSP